MDHLIEYRKMNFLLYTTLSFLMFFTALCQKCPSIYKRYSNVHSYCKPANSTCPVFHSGVTDAERKQIVDLHNKYRSKVATGKEKRAGSLPQAADMMQMVWDEELAAVSQKRAQQCVYEHDCSNCRRVVNFSVGQNIAYREMRCTGTRKCPLNRVPDWTDVIKMFYEEVTDFDKKYVSSMKFISGKLYGHFTQMVWAETWRIGCGFVAYQKGNGYRQLYVCNYGPSGNIMKKPMYEIGSPCSSCPINSCCGKSCENTVYAGLCRMLRNNEAPLYQPKEKYIFYCAFRNMSGDCSAEAVGVHRWKLVKALGGPFIEVVLKEGQTSTLNMVKTIKPNQNFCLVVIYRSGPAVAGQVSSNKAVISFLLTNARSSKMNLPKDTNGQQFFKYSMNLRWTVDTKVSITFSVPEGAPAQYFNIQRISAKTGRCK